MEPHSCPPKNYLLRTHYTESSRVGSGLVIKACIAVGPPSTVPLLGFQLPKVNRGLRILHGKFQK